MGGVGRLQLGSDLTLSIVGKQTITHLSHVFTNAVEGQAGLVGDDVEVLTNSLRGFLDFVFEF